MRKLITYTGGLCSFSHLPHFCISTFTLSCQKLPARILTSLHVVLISTFSALSHFHLYFILPKASNPHFNQSACCAHFHTFTFPHFHIYLILPKASSPHFHQSARCAHFHTFTFPHFHIYLILPKASSPHFNQSAYCFTLGV